MEVRFVKYSFLSKQKQAIDDPNSIEELTRKVEKAANHAKLIALSLQSDYDYEQWEERASAGEKSAD